MLATSFSANWRWSLLATTYWILAQHLRCVSPLAEVCSQASPNGSCGKSETRYYYDASTRVCQTFHWRGCLGIVGIEGNIFENAEECVKACNGTEETDESSPDYTVPSPPSASPGVTPSSNSLPPDPAIVTANPGNYFKLEYCLLPLDRGVPLLGFPPFPLFFFNSTSRQCEQFFLLGEGGNHNNFYDLKECLDKCGNLNDSFFEDTGSGDSPSRETSSEETTTTTTNPHFVNSPITSFPPFSPPPTQRPPSIPVPTQKPCVTEPCGTAATSSGGLTLPSELPSTDDDTVVTTRPNTVAMTTTDDFDTEANSVATTSQSVVVEGDKYSGFFLYATVAVILAVAMISLVAVGVAMLMVYRYQARKRMDAKFVGHQEQVRKALPSTSTCSSSVSV